MTVSDVMGVLQQGILVAVKAAAPILIVSMAIGLVISIFQAATQIHEQTLTFVPKLIAIVVILIVTGPWVMETMMDFMHYIFDTITKMY